MDPNSSSTLYEFVLSLHSLLRWAVVGFGALVLVQGLLGMTAGGQVGTLGKRLSLAFMISFDLQVLVGLALHLFLSPITKQGMQDMSASMKDPTQRYWVVEHGLTMILALAVVHIGRALAWRAKSERSAHFRRMITTAIALGLILIRAPWPFSPDVVRPWLRLPF
jgi:hypothetical protein